jgi:hypothetical protein
MMEMTMCDIQHLKRFAEANPELVSVRVSLRHPRLRVVKYKNKVFYKSLWTPELQEMRGLVIDENWNVVVRPFDKIFNRFENGTDFAPETSVVAVRKINGFMAAVTLNPEFGRIISTTGSLDSPFVAMAEEVLDKVVVTEGLVENVTYLFEIVHKDDPHIIEEAQGAYLIGARCIHSGINLRECDLDLLAHSMEGIMRPEWKITKFKNVVEEAHSCKHEGFVVYDMKGKSLKIKSPYYLTKKFFSRVKPEKLTVEWLEQNRGNFDEEFYGLIDYLAENRDSFVVMDQHQRRAFIEEYLER